MQFTLFFVRVTVELCNFSNKPVSNLFEGDNTTSCTFSPRATSPANANSLSSPLYTEVKERKRKERGREREGIK